MALRELVTQLKYELKDGNLKKYVEGYRTAEKQINAVAKAATTKLNAALGKSNGTAAKLDKSLRTMSPAMQQLALQARMLQKNLEQSNAPVSRIFRGFSRLRHEAREFAIGLRQGARQGYGEVLRQMDRVESKQRRINREARSSRSRSSRAGFDTGSVGGALQGLFALVSGKALADGSDEWAGADARIGLQTPDQRTRSRSVDFLFRTAQDTGQQYSSLADTFVSMARGRDGMGMSNDQTLQLSNTISKLMAIGGGSGASQDAALTQFGQAMNTGVLRGEELNSILEQAPRLAQAIAEALGTSVGKLKDLGQEGKITSKAIADGLLSQTRKVDAEFAQLPMTFSRSLTQIRNNFVRRAGELNRQYGIAERFNKVAQFVIQHMDKIGAALAVVASSFVAVKVFRALALVVGALQRSGRVAILFFDRLASGRVAQAFAKLGTGGLRLLKVLRAIGIAIGAAGALGLGVFAAVAALVVAAGLLIYKYWAPIKAFLVGFWQGFSESASQAFDELAVALRPLGPYLAAVVGWLKEMWTWFLNLIAPVNATQEELDQATASGKKFGQAMVANLRMVIAVIGLLVRGIVVVGQVMGAVTGVIGAAWDAIISRFRSGWAALTAAIPGGALNGVGVMGQLANGGSLASVAASSMVSAGRGSQSVSNTTNATVNVTPPAGGSPAAYGAAAQRGTSKALSSFQYQLPTAVEAF